MYLYVFYVYMYIYICVCVCVCVCVCECIYEPVEHVVSLPETRAGGADVRQQLPVDLRPDLTESAYRVVSQKSIPVQIRQLILYKDKLADLCGSQRIYAEIDFCETTMQTLSVR